MKIVEISTFSGIGGTTLGAEACGWNTAIFCEINHFCQNILRKHWPSVRIIENITHLTGEIIYEEIARCQPDVVVLTGGDPCQPSSVSGERLGKADPRFLWPEMLRVAKEFRFDWIVNENVTGSISNGILDQKISELEDAGYACWPPFIVPASAIGAGHERERVWLVAYSTCRRLERRNQCTKEGQREIKGRPIPTLVEDRDWAEYARSNFSGGVHGIPNRPHRKQRTHALGNAIVPQVFHAFAKIITEIENEAHNLQNQVLLPDKQAPLPDHR